MASLYKKILNVFPDELVLTASLLSPVVLAVFFYVKQYSSQLYGNDSTALTTLENNWIHNFMQQYQLVDSLNRFVDFAIWGVFALIVILAAWGIASVEVAVENHYAAEEFINFQEDETSWHQKFYIVIAIKAMLVVVSIYSIVALLIRYTPRLSVEIDKLIATESLSKSMLSVGKTCLIMTLYILIVVTCIRTFIHLRND